MSQGYTPVNDRKIYLCERLLCGRLVRTVSVRTTMAGAHSVCIEQLGSAEHLDRLTIPGAKAPRKPHYLSFLAAMNARGTVAMKRGTHQIRVTRIKINADL